MKLAEAATGRPSQPAQQTLMGRVVPQYPRHLVGQQPHKQTQQPPPYNPSCQAGSAMPQMMMRPAEAATGRPSQPAQQTLFVRVHVEPQFPRHPAGQQSRKLAGVGIIAPTHSLGLSLPSPSLPEPSYDVMSPHLGMLGALVSSFPEPKYDESSQRTKGGGRGQLRTASSSRPLRNSKQHLRRIKVEEVTPERRPWPFEHLDKPEEVCALKRMLLQGPFPISMQSLLTQKLTRLLNGKKTSSA
ncbi:Hypothetical predicted protein [Cloeon dipterum]|uniref:Uncharacterized protein n=1 Tax=Cloeon dipterum TaxID=197152 RepID=A0A8S1C6N5_9INSE|nr:Hypothetical predicted protein [Cloeon dipterum]